MTGLKNGDSISQETLSHLHAPADVAALGGVNQIVSALGSNVSSGLSPTAVEAARAKYGPNRLPDKEARSFWSHLLEAFEDDTLRILLASAFFSLLFAFFFSENSFVDGVQGVAIISAAVIVSGVNSFQNWSKDREFKSLSELKSDFKVLVLRSSKWSPISVYDVVVGDIVRIITGDRIPCDGLLLEVYGCEVDQSTMTGESTLVRKSLVGDPFIIGGCTVQEGEAMFVATAVGTSSKMGQTVALVETEEVGNTPLQDKLEELAGDIGRYGMIVGGLTFVVLTSLWVYNLPPENKWAGLLAWETARVLLKFFIVGLAIVVVAVPEGLPLAVTISLAFSMRRMMEDNNLVRQLQACETMGSATVIASDKTGTLTENRMSVVAGWVFGHSVRSDTAHSATLQLRDKIENAGSANRLGLAIALNSSANFEITARNVQLLGNPTEAALLFMLYKELDVDYSRLRADAGKPLARRAFDTKHKYMASLYAPEGVAKTDGPMLYVKGAPEVLLEMCTTTQTSAGVLQPITNEIRYVLHEEVLAMARRGLRTLAIAYRRLPKDGGLSGLKNASEEARNAALGTLLDGAPYVLGDDASPTGAESELTLLGLFGLADPLREGVTEALALCNKAGIRVMMVTGDHKDTASHIARECGILKPELGQEVMEGPQFRQLSHEDRVKVCSKLAVLARSSPTDKHLLVKTLKEMGEIVAVTGDGTNDAPALRAADVGLAMGIAGTEVAKEASDIVILDDRFSSIVASVRWGRSIKENIRKFLTFQLTINIVALTLTFVTACANGGDTETNFPITAVQLLWLNLIMDSFAALALATEPPSDSLMEYPPQGKDEPLITNTMFKNMIGHAIFQAALLLFLTTLPAKRDAFFEIEAGNKYPNTAVFTAFVALQVFNLFNCRAVHDEWNVLAGFSSSVIAQFIIGVICVMQVILVQFGGDFFQTSPLTVQQWLKCVAVGSSSIVVGIVIKIVTAAEEQCQKLRRGTGEVARPHGLLYGEAPSVRNSLMRTITQSSAELTDTSSAVAKQASAVMAEVEAEDDAADAPTRRGTVRSRRNSKASTGSSQRGTAASNADGLDLDDLVAGTGNVSPRVRRRPARAAAPPRSDSAARRNKGYLHAHCARHHKGACVEANAEEAHPTYVDAASWTDGYVIRIKGYAYFHEFESEMQNPKISSPCHPQKCALTQLTHSSKHAYQ